MTGWTPWVICLIAAIAALFLLRRPLVAAARLAARSAVGLGFLWLFNQVGALVGMQLGLNVFTGLAVGLLGFPGFGLLLLLQCI